MIVETIAVKEAMVLEVVPSKETMAIKAVIEETIMAEIIIEEAMIEFARSREVKYETIFIRNDENPTVMAEGEIIRIRMDDDQPTVSEIAMPEEVAVIEAGMAEAKEEAAVEAAAIETGMVKAKAVVAKTTLHAALRKTVAVACKTETVRPCGCRRTDAQCHHRRQHDTEPRGCKGHTAPPPP